MGLAGINERRLTFRHKVTLRVDLVLADERILPATLQDISENGAQFRCDAWIANEIEPRGIQNNLCNHITLKLVAEFDEHNKLYAQSRVISARRLSQDCYLIGLEFIDFEYGSEAQLLHYLETLD